MYGDGEEDKKGVSLARGQKYGESLIAFRHCNLFPYKVSANQRILAPIVLFPKKSRHFFFGLGSCISLSFFLFSSFSFVSSCQQKTLKLLLPVTHKKNVRHVL
jgi:hypothetical protein